MNTYTQIVIANITYTPLTIQVVMVSDEELVDVNNALYDIHSTRGDKVSSWINHHRKEDYETTFTFELSQVERTNDMLVERSRRKLTEIVNKLLEYDSVIKIERLRF